MCGISGVFDFTGHANVTHQRLRSMADTMVHRGPDDEGTFLSPDCQIGFGFRRLSIVDLTGGHQPMSSVGCPRSGGREKGPGAGGEVWTVFNGEIYNHAALRKELESLGHRYATRCDTESLIHGYEEWGEDVVHHLRGMFAFAVYDGRIGFSRSLSERPRLFLARDRLGVKPLYYTQQNGPFLFASEIKAMLVWPEVQRQVDRAALYHYLTLSVAPAPLTMFRDIRKLPPGHSLSVFGGDRLELKRYWDPLASMDAQAGSSETDIVERLREMVREAVRLRMMSDVPIGVFLSGGLDSSLNVGLMSELMDRPVDTFSVAIRNDPSSDELPDARRVAREFGADHHEVVITPQDFVDFLPKMVYHLDEPLGDPVCVPLYFVSKLARENGTTVIQVGEGADELFGGYAAYATMADFYRRFYRPFAALPRWIKGPVASAAGHVLPPMRAEYVQRAAAKQELFWSGTTGFSESGKRELLGNGYKDAPYDTYADVLAPHYETIHKGRPASSFLDKTAYMELKHRLPELLLMRVDKMTMATSVEGRVPYLDHELVQFALGIPSTLKYHRGRTKHILKEAARGILPDEVIDRPKTGFCGTSRNMVSGPVLDSAVRAVTESGWLRGIVDTDVFSVLVGEHRSGRRDHSMVLWCLQSLSLWHRHWIEGESLN